MARLPRRGRPRARAWRRPVWIPTRPPGAVSGTLAATIPALVAQFSGWNEALGPLAATIPPLSTSFTGKSGVSGTLAASLPSPVVDFDGRAGSSGILAAVLPNPVADFDGKSGRSGPLAATIPNLVASFTGTASAAAGITGSLASTLPTITTQLSGTSVTQYRFDPPTILEPPFKRWHKPGDPEELAYRISTERGVSVLETSFGVYEQIRFPAHTEILESLSHYLGGHIHTVNATEAAKLVAAGYGAYLTPII